MGNIDDAIKKIEAAVHEVNALNESTRADLSRFIKTLKSELGHLSKTHEEHAHSIIGFALIAAHEAARKDKAPHLLRSAIAGLALTVKGFEASHPKLTETINDICSALAQIGI